jgi:hypothetical protein
MMKVMPILALVLVFSKVTAQPFSLRSTGSVKTFQLDIFYSMEGKGAFVQYRGQQGTIPLKIRSRVVQRGGQGKPGPPKITYIWDEVIDGKATGSYSLTQEGGKLSNAWYRRNKDAKLFQLENATVLSDFAGLDKYLLHGISISFYHTSNDRLYCSYPNGQTQIIQLPEFDHPDPVRKSYIADYNFDGYDDLAFSIPDAGMGVYRTFSIFLYEPTSKRFKQLAEPVAPKAKCSGLCDVTLDQKHKLLFTSCRGAATWWKDVYRYAGANKLVWVSSGKQQ